VDPAAFDSVSEVVAYRILMAERSNTLLALEKICSVSQWPQGVPLSVILRRMKQVRPIIWA
jgi:hypothetical protein